VVLRRAPRGMLPPAARPVCSLGGACRAGAGMAPIWMSRPSVSLGKALNAPITRWHFPPQARPTVQTVGCGQRRPLPALPRSADPRKLQTPVSCPGYNPADADI
jgi:hypothetical protein